MIVTERANAQKWRVTSEGLIKNENNGRYMDVPSASLRSNYMVTWNLNNPFSKNQLWLKNNTNANYFVLKTLLNTNYSLSVNVNKSSILIQPSRSNDSLQIWSLVPLRVECPNECSNQGVCSITTGS